MLKYCIDCGSAMNSIDSKTNRDGMYSCPSCVKHKYTIVYPEDDIQSMIEFEDMRKD